MINAAVAALEKAYDLENAVMGQEQMRHLAETDPLTNCFNRRALMEKLEQEMDRAARYATMLTGMMIDIDNFKQINDTHGHLVGDRVLKQLANAAQAGAAVGGHRGALRRRGVRGAAAGDDHPPSRATSPSASCAGWPPTTSASPGRPVRVTISIGIASYPDERVTDGESLLRLADNHLYRAKSDGRNRFRD